MNKDLLYKIAITKIPMVGSITAKNLISYCGGVEAVFRNSKKALMSIPGVGELIADSVVNQEVMEIAEKEIEFIQENEVQPLFYLDDNYPKRLKHFDDSPVMLYYKGNADLNHYRNVAIVGTRRPTPRGKIHCEELVQGLANYNVNIISGLAYGIDVTAHKKALDVDLPTIGVMGNGLNMIYPSQHKKITTQMLDNGGILSEYTHDMGPDAKHFPMRNRIVAGLCDALVVIETATRGGSLITAAFANAYNKDVFAVPGRLNDKTSEGCNKLIKSHKAALLESVEDLAYIMRWEEIDKERKAVQKQLFVDLSPKENNIIELLRANDEIGIDQLSYQSNLPSSEMAGLLLGLEFKGLVKMLPGKRYMII